MKKIVKNKKLIIFLIILGIFCISQAVLAAELKELNADWPSSPLGTKLDADSELPKFIQYLYEWGISIGGLLVFIALIIAGLQYLASAGNPAMMNEAKSSMVSAGIGLALLLASWLILNTINPQLTQLQLPPFEPGEVVEIETTVTEEELWKMGEQLPRCEQARIMVVGYASGPAAPLPPTPGRTITIEEPDECKETYDSGTKFVITTDHIITVEGLISGEATSCTGLVELFSGTECDTVVDTYYLFTPEKGKPDKNVLSASFRTASVEEKVESQLPWWTKPFKWAIDIIK